MVKATKEAKKFFSTSYLSQKNAAKKHENTHTYDYNLSNMDSKVFVDKVTGKPTIVHRGTQNLRDVGTDLAIGLGLGKYTKRVKDAKRLTKKVENKYGQSANAVGHSLGGYLAENSDAHGNITTLNKAVGIADIGTKKNSKRQIDIHVKNDLIGLPALHTQRSNKEVINPKGKKFEINPFQKALKAHSTSNVEEEENNTDE
jgi:hypothetical protein